MFILWTLFIYVFKLLTKNPAVNFRKMINVEILLFFCNQKFGMDFAMIIVDQQKAIRQPENVLKDEITLVSRNSRK